MQKATASVGRPEEGKPTRYHRIKATLAVASQFIIASPLKLPPRVVAVAKYMALALGVLEAVENGLRNGEEKEETDEDG